MNPTDSPILRCEVAHAMVPTDRTQAECAHEHHCTPGSVCPLAGCFAQMFAAYRGMNTPVGSALTHSHHGR